MNKRRSPQTHRNKSPPHEFLPPSRNANPLFAVYSTPSKNDPFSSNEQSTKQERVITTTNNDLPLLLGEASSQLYGEKAFMKANKDRQKNDPTGKYSRGLTSNSEETSSGVTLYVQGKADKNMNSQKFLPANLAQKLKKNAHEKYHNDYYDNRIDALRGIRSKQKIRFYEKLSDSGDSAGSYHSGYSVHSEGCKIKAFGLKKYEKIDHNKPSFVEKQEDTLFLSKYSALGENNVRNKNINVIRPQYLSPTISPTISAKDNPKYECQKNHKKYSPQREDKKLFLIDTPKRTLQLYNPKRQPIDSQKYQIFFSNKKNIKNQKLQNQFKFESSQHQVQPSWDYVPDKQAHTPEKTACTKKYKTDSKHQNHNYHSSDVNQNESNVQKKVHEIKHSLFNSTSLKILKRPTQMQEDSMSQYQLTEYFQRKSPLKSTYQAERVLQKSQISTILDIKSLDGDYSRFPSITLHSVSQNNATMPFQFKILAKLAENKSSSIFQCLQHKTLSLYCLKKTKITPNNLKYIALEHKISTKLNHPNLVRSFCSFSDRKHTYLLMECMEGGTLLERRIEKEQDILKTESNSPLKALRVTSNGHFNKNKYAGEVKSDEKIMRGQRIVSTLKESILQHSKEKRKIVRQILGQILEGVVYLHRRNIWHRDLKPDNLYMSHGTYKIGDFGSSCFDEDQEHVGTLDYAAPQIMLKLAYNQSVDMWSMGCIAYELETGETPFYHPNRTETMRRIVNVEYNPSLIRDEHLANLISRMLIRQGDKRITPEAALQHPYFKQVHTLSRMRI